MMKNDMFYLGMDIKNEKNRHNISNAIDMALENIEARKRIGGVEDIEELETIRKKLIEMQLFEKNCWL